MCTVGAESFGPAGSAVLIQASMTQVVQAAKQPGRTVCFLLFIEMSYKSSPLLHRAWIGFLQSGNVKMIALLQVGCSPIPLCGDRLTYNSCKNNIIYYTKHKFCEGHDMNITEQLRDFCCGISLDVGFHRENIGPRGDD